MTEETKKRRPRKKKVEEVDNIVVTTQNSEVYILNENGEKVPVQLRVPKVETTDAPVKKTRSRKKKMEETPKEISTEQMTEEVKAEPEAPKPEKKRRTRKKVIEEASTEPVKEEAPGPISTPPEHQFDAEKEAEKLEPEKPTEQENSEPEEEAAEEDYTTFSQDFDKGKRTMSRFILGIVFILFVIGCICSFC